MERNIAIANRLREVFLNGFWIANTNYKEQLQKTHWQQAIHKLVQLNSIAALTYHINYYLAGLIKAFETGVLDIRDQYSFNMPPIQSEVDWHTLVDELLANASTFANQVEAMADAAFDQPFIQEKYGTCLRNIEAVIEHSYYHLGQIVLLKKMMM